MLWRAAVLLSLVGCAPLDLAHLAIPEGTRTLVIIEPGGSTAITRIRAALPDEALISDGAHGPLLIFGFDQELSTLGLDNRDYRLEPASPRRTPLPSPLFRAELAGGAALGPSTTSSAGLELPAFDWERILSQRRCAAGPYFLAEAKDCGPSAALAAGFVQAPEGPLLVPAGGCAGGSLERTKEIDRGPILGNLSIPYCAPPIRRSCAEDTLQAAGDPDCRPLGAACPAAGDFAVSLPNESIMFVRPGASGNGSRQQPFGSIATAVEAAKQSGARRVALARGEYSEALRLGGDIDLIGACPGATVLRGALVLQGHQGALQDVSITGGLDVGASDSKLVGVRLARDQRGLRTLVVRDGARLQVEDTRVTGPAGAELEVQGAALELVRADVFGRLLVASATVTLTGTALTATSADIPSAIGGSQLQLKSSAVWGGIRADRSLTAAEDTYFTLDQRPVTSSIASLFLRAGRAEIRRSVFESTEIFASPGTAQDAIVGEATALNLDDALFLLPQLDEKRTAAALDLYSLGDVDPIIGAHRLVVTGGVQRCQLCMAHARGEVVDLGAYQGLAAGLEASGHGLRVERYQGAGAHEAIVITNAFGGVSTVELREIALLDEAEQAVRILSGGEDMDVRIDGLEAVGAQGILIRGEPSGPQKRTGMLKVVARRVRVDVTSLAFTTSLDSAVELSEFDLAARDSAIHLRVAEIPVHHSNHFQFGRARGDIAAFLLDLNAQMDLEDLVDHVAIEGPTVVGY
ncbi:MAG: hypothetical protein U1E65_09235 [Myxococcota bacterium]